MIGHKNGGGVGCATSGLPFAIDAALIVAKSERTPDDGPATTFAGGRRRRCADTGNEWCPSCLVVIIRGEVGSTVGLAIRSFCQDGLPQLMDPVS
jgi:hypothetical protein